MKIWTLILTIFPILTFGQVTDNKKLIDSLRFVTEMPYACEVILDSKVSYNRDSMIYNIGCGDRFFWQVVKGKQEIIPLLLDRLDDTTQTIAPVPYFGGQYTVADIVYTALQEIIKDIPTFELLKINMDTSGCGYCSYWKYLRKDIKNREKFKFAVRNWYQKNKANLFWVTSNKVLTFDICSFNHPNRGHFEVKK